MRADMSKVIVERPRYKGWAWNKPKGYARKLRRYGEDGPPGREGIKARWQSHSKSLNEHLGPLRRYLDSQVGRPWDKVFAEICAHIDRNSAVQDHVRDHVEDYVIVHVIYKNGVPCSGEGNSGYGRPLSELWCTWYVCPRPGLLRRLKPRKRRPRKRPAPAVPAPVRLSDELQCHFLEGAWHLVSLKPVPAQTLARLRSQEWDIVLNRRIADIPPEAAKKRYGAALYATAKRRLAQRELRHYPIPRELWL